MDEREREFWVQFRRGLINLMRAEQEMVRAIEQRLELKPMNGRPEAKIASQR